MSGQGLLAIGVPPQPLWLLYIKIAILVLSLIVLALAAYGLSLFSGLYIGGGGAPGMDIFVAIYSFIIYGGAISTELWAPHFFYRIGVLIGNILSIIFWLSAWAWSASTASAWMNVFYNGGDKNYGGAMAGAAAMGAIVWILAIINNVFFIRACVIGTGVAGQAELGQVKAGEVPPQGYQQPYGQPQQQYQQPYAQPQQPYATQQPGPYATQ